MKTPKRKKNCLVCVFCVPGFGGGTSCANGCLPYAEVHGEESCCDLHNFIRARWKRKNREAQLKRTIARLKQELAKTKQDLYVCESCIEVYESAAEGEKWNAAIWKKEATALVARFGQDIEGS